MAWRFAEKVLCDTVTCTFATPSLLYAVALVALGAAPARADDVQWTAVELPGPQRDCSDKHMNTHWVIVETATRITLQADTRSSGMNWHLSTRDLNADGSGHIAVVSRHGRPAWFEFTPGHGPRTIHFSYNYHACVWQLSPT